MMRLTVEQRLQALERETVVLHDTIKLLHRLLKEQAELINDYIIQKVSEANDIDGDKGGSVRPVDALFTFVCRRRFDKIDNDIKRLQKSIEDLRFGVKAG